MNPIDIFIMNFNAQRPTIDSLVQGSIYFPRQTDSVFELDYRHPVNIIEEDEDEDPFRMPLRQTADYQESYYNESERGITGLMQYYPPILEPLRLINPDSMRIPSIVFPTIINIIGSDEATDNETDADTDTELDDVVVTPSAPRPMVREQRTQVTTIEQIAFRLARRTATTSTTSTTSTTF